MAWYWCEVAPFAVPPGHRALVRFESVDYAARVWINGHEIGGHEGDGLPFELDATQFLEPGRTNLLAVRVINPGREPIDGLVLAEVPHSNKVPADEFRPGWGYNTGGIVGEVVLHVEPPARLLDVVVRPRLRTGVVEVDAVVSSAANSGPAMSVDVLVSEDSTGFHVAHARRPVEPSGSPDERITVHLEAQVALDQLKPWDIDDPFLYLVRVRLDPKSAGDAADEMTVRTGFRELRVRDGWFELNGRRIYLRATHTGNHYPIGQAVPQGPALVRQDLVYAEGGRVQHRTVYRRRSTRRPAGFLRRARLDGLRGDAGGVAAR